MDGQIAVYVHIPFCPSKCGYCDFNSYAMDGPIMDRTVLATIEQIRRSRLAGRPAKTIFFGGGTPTFIPIDGLIQIFQTVCEVHPPIPDAEITSEANPGTVDTQKFALMREAGFNRISLGGQSFLDQDLIRLGRIHRSGDIERAVRAAREAGFDNINVDLMFGLAGQNAAGWRHNLHRVIDLQTEHISLYCLTIEPQTAFYREVSRSELILPDEDVQVEMYDLSMNLMQEAGLEQYEISNFARPGRECKHNLEYWSGAEYAGYGPGAVASYDLDGGRVRATSLKHPVRYCEAIETHRGVEYDIESLDESVLRTERIMLGLRLNRGISRSELGLEQVALTRLANRGWVYQLDDQVRLTEAGRHFCSEATLELV